MYILSKGRKSCNGKVLNNGEKKGQREMRIVRRRVTVKWRRRSAKNKWEKILKKNDWHDALKEEIGKKEKKMVDVGYVA